MSKKHPRRIQRPLPEMSSGGVPLSGLTVSEYSVGSWCPTTDGSGPAEAVALQFVTKNPAISIFLRLKSPAAVDELISALQRHKEDVWPIGKG